MSYKILQKPQHNNSKIEKISPKNIEIIYSFTAH